MVKIFNIPLSDELQELLSEGEEISSRTETGLGCSCSAVTSEHLFSSIVESPPSKSLEPVRPLYLLPSTNCFRDSFRTFSNLRRSSATCTASMIFFSAFRSSSHFCRAPRRSFRRFSVEDSGGECGGISSSPIRRATKAGVRRKFSCELTDFDRRISAGMVGLRGTSQESRRRSGAEGRFSGGSVVEFDSGGLLGFVGEMTVLSF